MPPGVDPRARARELARVHDEAISSGRPHAAPRPIIGDSWRRLLGHGMDPDHGGTASVLGDDQVEQRRSRSRMSGLLPTLRTGLGEVADHDANIMVVTDADGRVLWREGSRRGGRGADRLGFVPGSCWSEDVVGTNAIGTALVVGAPMQVYSAEHFVRSHHPWTCSAAPVRDPREGSVLGAVDLSGPASSVHPTTLALIRAVARLAESELRARHRDELDRLRAVAAPLLAGPGEPAVVTDRHGWVAGVRGLAPLDTVMLPEQMGQRVWLPAFGDCAVDPVPGGWLIRTRPSDPPRPGTAELDLGDPHHARLRLTGDGGSWEHPLTPRHAEILYVLARRPEGRTAAELAVDLFGDPRRQVSVRAEMSRLRRHLAGVLDHRPYRFTGTVRVTTYTPSGGVPLPYSQAPGVRALRGGN
ncbi:GAF domain-containing protein [Allosaccharopolyspora coralli]|uniref:GAF domain-containing protein n=1 Tax=Allosaccharopolyspora coralli TaxID=2665642 RepID=A0A5Q3QKZ5_9PSEU|nr:GAF domain-containing protein [Allosaccharopolyspora coralli]